MKKIFKTLLTLCFISIYCSDSISQTKQKFNLNLERKTNEKSLPNGWNVIGEGDYNGVTDSINKHKGIYSGKIISTKANTQAILFYEIPAKYGTPKLLELEGDIKTSLKNGQAGLFIGPKTDKGYYISMENMSKSPITGDTDWKRYKTSLAYPNNSAIIHVGLFMSGEGEAWIDNLTLKLDGIDVQIAKELKKIIPKAELDTQFDKGSGFTSEALKKIPTDDLELLGRVWGFLKYYHPKVASGDLNWDYELFRFLNTYKKASSKLNREELLFSWIETLGEYSKCTTCETKKEDVKLKPNLEWIGRDLKNESLKNKLLDVYNNRHLKENYYYGFNPTGYPTFPKEKPYADMPYPDAGFRMLALYKEWNIINYFFPYKYLTDKDWDKLLTEYIPLFLEAENELEYEVAAIKLTGEIKDTHANLWGGKNKIVKNLIGRYSAPAIVKFIENKLVVTGFYNDSLQKISKLKIGDVITKINGKKIKKLIEERNHLYPASNKPTMLRDMARDFLRSPQKKLNLEYRSNGKNIKGIIDLYTFKDLGYRKHKMMMLGEKSHKILNNNIGYINLLTLKRLEIADVMKKFANTEGIIIDIRNYPQERVLEMLASYFVKEAKEYVKFSVQNFQNIGEFRFVKNKFEIKSNGKLYDNKIVVIVNEITQSQAEFTAMAFKVGVNTTIIGSQTAGADGDITELNLPGNLKIYFSALGIYYPNGDETQRIGIVPDIEVKPTIKGIKEGRDELLEKAVQLITNKK